MTDKQRERYMAADPELYRGETSSDPRIAALEAQVEKLKGVLICANNTAKRRGEKANNWRKVAEGLAAVVTMPPPCECGHSFCAVCFEERKTALALTTYNKAKAEEGR